MASRVLRSALSLRPLTVRSYSVSRPVFRAAASTKDLDPIQQLFINKLREYAANAQSTKDGLFEATAEDQQMIRNDEENLKKRFGELNMSAVSKQLVAPHPPLEEPSAGNPLETLDPVKNAKSEVAFNKDNYMFYDLNLPAFMWPEIDRDMLVNGGEVEGAELEAL